MRFHPALAVADAPYEIEYQDPIGNWGRAGAAETKSTELPYMHVGAQPGRWRVWAVGDGGRDGPTSGWWTFNCTR